MAIKVRIPAPLRKLTNELDVVSTEDGSLQDCLNGLEAEYPGLKERICDEGGEIRRFVNIYVNGEDVRFLEGLSTVLEAGDEVSIVPAVAGGS